MPIYEINPIQDPRWGAFVASCAASSVFHTVPWLRALQRSYGYEPLVVTTTPPGKALENGLVFCCIRSWLTGSRIVSLPFSDHCQPLVDDSANLFQILSSIRERSRQFRYFEMRPRVELSPRGKAESSLVESESFCFHSLDLRSSLEDIHRRFHKNSIRKPLERAVRERLTEQKGQSEAMLSQFYSLLMLTRRRHQLPPQPLSWFRHLLDYFGENATIRVAYKSGRPVASIFTLAYKRTVVYKYGCSDARCNSLGGTPYLLWNAIQEAKNANAEEFDLGRSEWNQTGLIRFKDRWGASRSQLTYYRYPKKVASGGKLRHWSINAVSKAFASFPDFCLETAGRLLYKHVG